MNRFALQGLDDAALLYRLEVDGAPAGEIRRHAMDADVLHVPGANYWLAHDEGVALRERGAGPVRRFVEGLRLDRSYSLRDAHATLATARRRWTWSVRRDRIDFEAGAMQARITPRRAFGGDFEVRGPAGPMGRLRLVGLNSHRVELDGLALTAPQAALLMYALQRCWGGGPHRSEGGE